MSHRQTLSPAPQLVLFTDMPNLVHPSDHVRDPAIAPKTPRDRRDIFGGKHRDGLTEVGFYDIPAVAPCTLVPERMIAFSEAVARRTKPDPVAWVHFYEDDYRFLRFQKNPEKYFECLRPFGGVIGPDCSLYRNMPRAKQIYATYTNQQLTAQMQADGFNVIPNVRLNGADSIPWALAGIPGHSTLAIGLHGCIKSAENRPHVMAGIKMICDNCRPSDLVVYGSGAYHVLGYPRELEIPVHLFAPDTWRRSKDRRAA